MKVIIPAAGIGTRLQPLTNKIPKVLVNVAGKPMMFHFIDELIKNQTIDSIIIIIGYMGEQIVDAVNKHYVNSGVKFEFVEQKEMLGLGHAVYHAKNYAGSEPVLIVLGDTIFEIDVNAFLDSQYSVIGVKDVEDIRRWGIVETEKGFITRMIEKPSGPEITNSKKAIAGIYLIQDASKLFNAVEFLITNNIRTKNEFQITDALQKMVNDGEKMVTFHIQNWFDCGKPETLLSTNQHILTRDFSNVKSAEFPGSKITTLVFIGKDCIIENSEVGPNVTVGDNVTIKNSKITNSLIYDKSNTENAALDEVILGIGEYIDGEHNKIIKADGLEAGF